MTALHLTTHGWADLFIGWSRFTSQI